MSQCELKALTEKGDLSQEKQLRSGELRTGRDDTMLLIAYYLIPCSTQFCGYSFGFAVYSGPLDIQLLSSYICAKGFAL